MFKVKKIYHILPYIGHESPPCTNWRNCHVVVMVIMIYWVVYLTPLSGQIKDYKIVICCFSAKNMVLRTKSKDWLTWKRDNVSKWSDMSNHDLSVHIFSEIYWQIGQQLLMCALFNNEHSDACNRNCFHKNNLSLCNFNFYKWKLTHTAHK